jgi:hypothetical protein
VVYEDHPEFTEAVHHQPVVNDLMEAIDGRLEHTEHPGEGLDRHLHPSTEAAGRSQENEVDI